MSFLRLYKSSIFVGILASFVLALMIVPGRGSHLPWFGGSGWLTLEHGWPWKYLRRQLEVDLADFDTMSVGPGRGSGPWLTGRHWRFGESLDDSRWSFRPSLLFCDIIVAIAVMCLVVGAWELWRRRRGGRVRFRIIDLFVLATAICAAFGWLKYLDASEQRERQVVPQTWHNWGAHEERCVAPLWLQAIVGDRLLPDYFWRVTSAEIDPSKVDDPQQVTDQLAKLEYLDKVVIRWSAEKPFPYSALNDVPQVRHLDLRNTTPIGEHDANELAKLHRVRKITYTIDFSDPNRLNIVDRLRTALPGCEIVDTYDDW